MVTVRAKFKVEYNQPNATGDCNDITLRAVFGDENPENKEFFKWTPSGQITLGVVNKLASETLEVGKEFYVDFIAVPAAEAEPTV